MMAKKKSRVSFLGGIFGFFLAAMMMFTGVTGVFSQNVYAEPETETTTTTEETTEEPGNGSIDETETYDHCQSSLGSIGWLVCPTTGKIAEAVDWLYEKIEDVLVVNPIAAEDGTPIYEIWKYCRGLTNVVFIIFLMVVIYSQLTGMGISNYGIKKILPKIIVVAVLVNLSFLLCSLAVDVSNIVGGSLRGIFTSVQEAAVANMPEMATTDMAVSQSGMYTAIAGGTALAIGGAVIAFETGAIWMLIPVLLGAIVAVVTGLVTIAMRQAVVALLIMISPLAIVAYMLPNTEHLFTKWKKLLTQMLVFYPMFAVLFGASQLAGFAIIASAKDGFMVLLGVAVQIFPLFFSWKMMKMSGTVLGTINGAMQRMTAAPLSKNRAWADSHRQLSKQRYLASDRAVTPSLRLMQFVSNRRVAREAEISDKAALAKNRGLAYRANRNYNKNGVPTRRGEKAYRDQALSMEYQRAIERDKNNMNKGLGQLEAVKLANPKVRARLDALDTRVVNAADYLNIEKSRGEKIEYDNAKGFHERLEAAMNAHMDSKNGYIMDTATDAYILDENGKAIRNPKYKLHLKPGSSEFDVAMGRYGEMENIMEGNVVDVQFAAAKGAVSYDTQKKILENAYQKYFELTPPTKDVEFRLGEITTRKDAQGYIDAIIPGLRILNQRGDTDLVRAQISNVLNDAHDGVQLGSHASQALASFLMFDVKDNDPFLRRFGKYINLETARAFNANDRKAMDVTFEEYIKGYHEEPSGERMYAKKSMTTLLEGTSFDNVERTAFDNMNDALMEAYGFDKKHPENDWDKQGYLSKLKETQKAILPQFISANLKYLSGSEQISAAVKFLTGYKSEPIKDENGNVIGATLSEPVWDKYFGKSGDAAVDEAERATARGVFQELTRNYLESQTPTQILSLRSDYKDALTAHLAAAYEADDEMKGWSEEAIEERRQYMAEKAEIQTRYGDLPAEEANRRRAEDLAKLRKERSQDWTAAQFRQLLDAKGKLNQIYRTRRSGAANNAKDWVRGWLELDNEVAITQRLDDNRKKEKKALEEEKRKERASSDDGGAEDIDTSIYTEIDRMAFMTKVDDIWQDYRDDDDEVFYERSVEYLREILGEGSYIEKEYERYHKEDASAGNYELREYLKGLLSEEGNY